MQFSPQLRGVFDRVLRVLDDLSLTVYSAHRAEDFGEKSSLSGLVERDNGWVAQSDIYLALLPLQRNGHPWRTDGTFVELGLALGLRKPVILIIDEPTSDKWSWYVRDIQNAPLVQVVDMECLRHEPKGILSVSIARAQAMLGRRDSSAVELERTKARIRESRIAELHEVHVHGIPLIVDPGVFSPRFSLSGSALIERWTIPKGARVLDVGCGSGLLSVAALRAGASYVVAVDINPQACQNTRSNLMRNGFDGRFDVVRSDCYSGVKGRFDVIVSNPPYWDHPAQDVTERACFDEGHSFLRSFIVGAKNHATDDGKMFIVSSDQGNTSLIPQLLQDLAWTIEQLNVVRPVSLADHIRLVWAAKRGV